MEGQAGSPPTGEGQRWGATSFAQHGDDFFLINLFELMGIDRPSYLDIGAHHPWNISNTALMYMRGSRGVNIEANPGLLEAFCEYRKEDLNINIGIAPGKAGQMQFFMFNETSGLNTFDPIERDQTIAAGQHVQKTIYVNTMTLNQAVEQYCFGKWPDLLSMDIEGLDFAVLESSDLQYPNGPKIICVEVRHHMSQRMKDLLLARGYIFGARLAENMIFVRSDLYAKVF